MVGSKRLEAFDSARRRWGKPGSVCRSTFMRAQARGWRSESQKRRGLPDAIRRTGILLLLSLSLLIPHHCEPSFGWTAATSSFPEEFFRATIRSARARAWSKEVTGLSNGSSIQRPANPYGLKRRSRTSGLRGSSSTDCGFHETSTELPSEYVPSAV